MSRPKGSRNRLVTLDYDVIGALVGIRGNTARRYAQRGEYDARSLASVMKWINRRRTARGWPLIGLPDGDNQVASDDTAANDTPLASSLTDDPWRRFLSGAEVYVRTIAEHRSIYDL